MFQKITELFGWTSSPLQLPGDSWASQLISSRKCTFLLFLLHDQMWSPTPSIRFATPSLLEYEESNFGRPDDIFFLNMKLRWSCGVIKYQDTMAVFRDWFPNTSLVLVEHTWIVKCYTFAADICKVTIYPLRRLVSIQQSRQILGLTVSLGQS